MDYCDPELVNPVSSGRMLDVHIVKMFVALTRSSFEVVRIVELLISKVSKYFYYRDLCIYSFQIYTHITRQQMISTRPYRPIGLVTHTSRSYNTLTVQVHVYTQTHVVTSLKCSDFPDI